MYRGSLFKTFIALKYLIAGLGNIGPDYAETRHNIGFMVVDGLASRFDSSFEPARYGDRSVITYKSRTFILLKPSTYMNRSGRAVNYWLNKEKLTPDRMLVVVDDVSLPLGKLRMRAKGGDGGHNGLESIIAMLGHNNFPRLRFGIGSEYPKGYQVAFVLGKWEKEEMDTVKQLIKTAGDMALSFGTIGIERAMNLYNK